FRAMGHQWGIGAELFRLGAIAHARGDHAAALALYGECLRVVRELGDRAGIADPLHAVGAIRASHGTKEQLEQAARLMGAADALREAFSGPPIPIALAECQRRIEIVRRKLGSDAFATAWAAGRDVSLSAGVRDRLVAETLEWVEATSTERTDPQDLV